MSLTSHGRRKALGLFGSAVLLPLIGCGERKTQRYTILDVEMFSYVDRVVTDIIFNGIDLGVMNRFGGTGTITGVRIPFGVQRLHWTLDGPEGTPRNGEVVHVRNAVELMPDRFPSGTGCLGLHLYPDDSIELTFAEFTPERTERGKKITAAAKAKRSELPE